MTDTPDLMSRIARAGARIDPALTDGDVERVVHAAHRKAERRAGRRTLGRLSLVLIGAGAAALAVAHFGAGRPGTIAPEEPSRQPGALRLRDGSRATPMDAGTVLAIVDESPNQATLDLARGRARFEVVPSPRRVFIVRVGDVSVTDLGTVFVVERVADRVGVTVERGTVRVDWKVGARLLRQGEAGWFPPLVVDARALAPSSPPSGEPVVPPEHARPRHAGGRREIAEAIPGPAPETAGDLMAAADAERLAGHAEAGAAILRRLLRDHRGDARAPLASFTLGRLLLRELGRPAEAAAAFADVRLLAPGGPFAEDALAREVEAWHRAGDSARARVLAHDYGRLYPQGLHLDAVKVFGDMK